MRNLLFSVLFVCILCVAGCDVIDAPLTTDGGEQSVVVVGSANTRDDVHVVALMRAMEELLTDEQYSAVVKRASELYEEVRQQIDASK